MSTTAINRQDVIELMTKGLISGMITLFTVGALALAINSFKTCDDHTCKVHHDNPVVRTFK